MLRIAAQTLRTRKGGFAGAFVALVFAAAIITACGILMESGARSSIPTERYGAADLVVSGERTVKIGDEKAALPASASPGLPSDAIRKIQKIPGVDSATGELSFDALIAGHEGGPRILGHNWGSASLASMHIAQGAEPAAGQVVLDAGLATRADAQVGDTISVQTNGTPQSYLVSGIADGAKLKRQSAIYFSEQQASVLAGRPGIVGVVGITLSEGAKASAVADAISTAIPHSKVYDKDDRGLAEFNEAQEVRGMLSEIGGSLGGIAIVVAIFVVASTLAVSVSQRHREVALLRATGATPRQIRRMIRGEAMLLALVAGAVGVIPGILGATWLQDQLVDRGMMPGSMQLTIGWAPMVAAVGIGVVVSWLAAWSAARRASKVHPTQALHEAAMEPRRIGVFRTILGMLVLGGGVALISFAMSTSGETASAAALGVVMVLMVAVGLLGPVLAKMSAWIATPFLRLFSSTGGYLAAANTRAHARRLAGAITPLILAVALALVGIGVQTTAMHAATNESKDGLRADYVVVSRGPGVPRELAGKVAAIDGVAASTSVIHTEALVKGSDGVGTVLPVLGADGSGLTANMDLDVTSGDLDSFTGNRIAVSRLAESTLGAKLGDELQVWLPDGTQATVTVAAFYDRGLGFGDLALPHDLVAGHTTTDLDEAVLVRAEPGATGVEQKLSELAGSYTHVQVTDRDSYSLAQDKAIRDNAWLNYVIIGVLVAFTVVAMVNTLVMTVLDRSRELALLRLVGATVGQARAMLRWESVVVIGTALAFGALVAVATLVPFAAGVAGGLPWLPWWYTPLVIAGAIGLGAAAILLPARGLLRLRAADVIGGRE